MRTKEKDVEKYWEKEFFDVIQPLIIGAAKNYPDRNWLEPNGMGTGHKENYASIQRHVSEAYMKVKLSNNGTVDPRLCAACRLLMDYTRDMRNIKNPGDEI